MGQEVKSFMSQYCEKEDRYCDNYSVDCEQCTIYENESANESLLDDWELEEEERSSFFNQLKKF